MANNSDIKYANTKDLLTASSFNRSIERALRNPPDVAASIRRIKHMLSSLPEGKLYSSDRGNEVIFYIKVNNHHKYMSKRSRLTYALARKMYLLLLLEILELTESDKPRDILRRKTLIIKLQNLIDRYDRGNLELARIILTSKQYKWYTSAFVKKPIDKDTPFRSSCGVPVRSKSERDILNANEELAVPVHYEEQQLIQVHSLVKKLQNDLKSKGSLRGQVYDYRGNYLHWNVPPELEWMNSRGSIWMSFYPPNGTIRLFNDFRIMLADGSFFIWEHEGLMDDFLYRCNASERASIMKYTGTINRENLLETYEQDIDNKEKITDIIERYILPRLWF